MKRFYLNTGTEVRRARERAGMSRRALADAAGLHPNSIKRLEGLGDIPCSSWYALKRVAPYLPWFVVINPPIRREPRKERLCAAKCAPAGVVPPVPEVKKLCGARTRKGPPCVAPARPNGRCRMHGGLSTGPRTPEGRQRIVDALRRRLRRRASQP
jgi:hypothetical protein